MAHGLRGFSVMGGKRGGEDWLTLCQGSEGSGMARVRERCGPQGHAPTALLPYLGPTCFPIQVLPPRFCHPIRIHSVLRFISSSPAKLPLPRRLCRHPIVDPQHLPFSTDLKAFRWSILEWWSANSSGIASDKHCDGWSGKPALGIRGKSVPSGRNKTHRILKFGVRNRKVSAAGTSPFEGVWHLMNLEVQSEPLPGV